MTPTVGASRCTASWYLAQSTSGSDTVSVPIPMATWGVYVASDSAASLALAMPSATTPATVAATAATAGTVRVRCRAASRTAYRATRGSRRARRASDGHHDGHDQDHAEHRDHRRAGDQQAAVAAAEVVARRPGHGAGDADAEQDEPEQRRAQARLPVAPATGEDGHHVLTGGDGGRDHRGQEGAQHAEPRDEEDVPPGQVERAEPGVGVVLHDREQGPADADAQDDAQHRGHHAEDQPSGEDHAARLLRRTSAGGHQGQGPGLPSGADRERRAGQEHHLEQRHHHDQHDDRDERVVGRGLPLRELGREHGVRGRVLDDRARQHCRADLVQGLDVVPRDRAAAHQPGRLALGASGCPASRACRRPAGSRAHVVDSAVPTTVRVWPSWIVSSDPAAKPFSASASFTTTSVDAAGQRPSVSRNRPSTRGESEVELGGLDVEDASLGVDADPAVAPFGGGDVASERRAHALERDGRLVALLEAARRVPVGVEPLDHPAAARADDDPRVGRARAAGRATPLRPRRRSGRPPRPR